MRICADLADDVGVAFGEADAVAAVRRDDYALAAGPDSRGHGPNAIATGNDSVNWAAVPPGIFDAAEDTVEWRVEAADGVTKAVVHVELSGSGLAEGITVRLRSGGFGGAGVLDADGRSDVPSHGRGTSNSSRNRLRGIMIGGRRPSRWGPMSRSRRTRGSGSETSCGRGCVRLPTMRSWPKFWPRSRTTDCRPLRGALTCGSRRAVRRRHAGARRTAPRRCDPPVCQRPVPTAPIAVP